MPAREDLQTRVWDDGCRPFGECAWNRTIALAVQNERFC